MAAPPAVVKRTAGAACQTDITSLLKARNALLLVISREEHRAQNGCKEAAAAAGFITITWDCVDGLRGPDGKAIGDSQRMRNPDAAIAYIRENDTRAVYVMRDLHQYYTATTLRALRNAANELPRKPLDKARAIVILTPVGTVPPELSGCATYIDYPLPDREEMGAMLRGIIEKQPDDVRETAATAEAFTAARDASLGLSSDEAAACIARSLVQERKINPRIIGAEKKRVIAKEKVLSVYDPDPRGLAAVGGLELVKDCIAEIRSNFSDEARDFGVRVPKGILLLGVPGCGKDFTAKAIASELGYPCLKFDGGAMKSKWMGESEGNTRLAYKVAAAMSPCVLWFSEIEKMFGGATGPAGDGGVAQDALGTFLIWMQEHTEPVFVIATANDISALPAEMLRVGRFDRIFFVDLPTTVERAAILKACLYPRTLPDEAYKRIAAKTTDFTGAELDGVVTRAVRLAFNDGKRPVTVEDMLAVAARMTPQAKADAEKIRMIRERGRARGEPASLPEATAEAEAGGNLDL